jgi:hypothetical protein
MLENKRAQRVKKNEICNIMTISDRLNKERTVSTRFAGREVIGNTEKAISVNRQRRNQIRLR